MVTRHHITCYLNEEFFLDVKSTLYEISGFIELEQDSLMLDTLIQFFTVHFLESQWPEEKEISLPLGSSILCVYL